MEPKARRAKVEIEEPKIDQPSVAENDVISGAEAKSEEQDGSSSDTGTPDSEHEKA